jgi:ribonuclease-3 family protein
MLSKQNKLSGITAGDTPEERIKYAKNLAPVQLAFIGDCVYELLAREKVIDKARFQKETTALVRASYQSAGAERIHALLTEEEADIFRRGKNANPKAVPRSATQSEYRRATGLEALFGYLYIIGSNDRICQLFEEIYDGNGQNG